MTDADKKKLLEEDIKRKDWTSQDWMESTDDLDRLVWFISSLSPHNLWKAKEAIRGRVAEAKESVRQAQDKETAKKMTVMSDFPTAWKIMSKTDPSQHHEKCSYRQTNRAILCDCAAEKVFIETCKLTEIREQVAEKGK